MNKSQSVQLFIIISFRNGINYFGKLSVVNMGTQFISWLMQIKKTYGNSIDLSKKIFLLLLISLITNTISAQDSTKKKAATRILYGTASYYSNKFQGRKTANGEKFDQKKMTAACNVLPLGTWIKVTNLRNKKTVIVKINDRLHHKMKRIVDLSRVAALQLNFIRSGLTRVKVEVLGKKKPKE